jgi:hemerythrin-like domain-containing protein
MDSDVAAIPLPARKRHIKKEYKVDFEGGTWRLQSGWPEQPGAFNEDAPSPAEPMKTHPHRRNLFQAGTGLFLACAATLRPVHADEKSGTLHVEISPPEDLMREHGVLNRVLLIYEAAVDRFARNDDFDVSAVTQAAQVIREFIEGYHERNEERYLFPRFRRAGKQQDLVDTLYQQHQAGRRLTDTILSLVPDSQRPGDGRTHLVASLRTFVCMYRPHEAREDTELFRKSGASCRRTNLTRWPKTSSERKGGASGRTVSRRWSLASLTSNVHCTSMIFVGIRPFDGSG